jgi:hypothetical protein
MTDLHTDEAAPRLFECDIDRSQTKMPDDYLPDAPGVLIAGEDMLRAAGYVPGSNRPRGWLPAYPRNFRRRPRHKGDHMLWVRKCGELWIIARSLDLDVNTRKIETLVFAILPLPIWTRSYQAAMRLAEYCHPIPRTPVAGYWAEECMVRMVGGRFVCTVPNYSYPEPFEVIRQNLTAHRVQ